MQHKTKKIWLIALLSLLIAALFAASFTYARYYKETGVTGGKYDDTIEFVGANKYIVYSPEELVSAIENGYSYIEIGEGAEEPFVITDGVTDVTANLVLDINGHDLVRNSRNPLIDVQKNVSVVIVYDSKSSGSFYNPVGSLLQASGGTLTIATGDFTSGPKAGDYVTDVGTEEDYVKDTGTTEEGVSYSLGNYTVYYRDGYTPGADSPNRSGEYIDTGVEAKLPKIVPVVIDPEAKDRYGNIYFQKGIENNAYIKEDTFLIYTEETVDASEGTTVDFEPLCDVASCDFYYYYVTDTDGSGEDKTTTYAVIYGYNDVMAGAEQQITKEGFNESEDAIIDPATAVIWPYATVRMTQGEAFIRGGSYTNRFGTAQSYGIYARGGSLSVQGENTSFTSVADGVCIRCTTEGDAAPSLHIENGSFTSYNGDTVQVNGGTMTVNSGTFTKSGDSTDNSTKTAIIHMTGGALTAAGSADASGKKSIQMTCAASTGGSTLSNVFGVYSEGGTVELQNTQINVNGTYSAGVLAVTDGQAMSADEYAVTFADSAIEVNFNESALSSSGISTEGGNIQLEGDVSVFSQGLGITARTGSINIASGTAAVTTQRGTGVYVNNGTLTVNEKATLSVKPTMSENSWVNPPGVSGDVVTHYDGVVVEGGSLVSNGTLNVTMINGKQNSYTSNMYDDLVINSFAVRVLNAETVTILNGDITNDVGGGVYVGGGTVELGDESTKAGPTVKTTGIKYDSIWYDQNGDKATGQDAWHFHKNTTGGHAVEVVGGNLTIHGGKYSASMGNGIQVNNQESDSVIINGGTFSGADAYTPGTTDSAALAGPGASYAFKMYGGSVTINGGTFGDPNSLGGGAFVTGSGSLAKATILAGTFDVGGTAAFTVYQNAELTFGTQGDTANNELLLKGESAGLTVEKLNGGTASSVTIHSGTFSGGNHEKNEGGCDGIYYNGSGQTRLTITGGDFVGKSDNVNYGRSGLHLDVGPAVKNAIQISGGKFIGEYDGLYYGANGNVVHGMVISGGEFIGTDRSGLYFNVNQWANGDGNVSISGGTFIGNPEEHTEYIYVSPFWKTWYTDGAIGAGSEHYNEGLGWSIQIFDLVDQNCSVDYYNDDNTIALTQTNNRLWTEDDRPIIALNVTGCKYSKVVVR